MSVKVSAQNIENFDDQRIANGIEDLIADLAANEKILPAQNRKVLRGVGLFDTEPLDQGPSRQFAVSQLLDDRDSSGVGQCLKEVSLELTKCILHRELDPF